MAEKEQIPQFSEYSPAFKAYEIRQLGRSDVHLLKDLLKVFSEAFDDFSTYQSAVPADTYLESMLGKSHVIALIALYRDNVVGGLTAYQLDKFEQDRREIYIYDLGVLEAHRLKGIARSLIQELKRIAKDRAAYVIFVQADSGDTAPIRLYESLGKREDVHNFDIPVDS